MNERIQQLALQAREYANSKEPYEKIKNKAWIDVYDEKFAELIVRECINQCADNDSNDEWDKGVRWAAAQIKQHFGVEE
jgi:hypothetical protein